MKHPFFDAIPKKISSLLAKRLKEAVVFKFSQGASEEIIKNNKVTGAVFDGVDEKTLMSFIADDHDKRIDDLKDAGRLIKEFSLPFKTCLYLKNDTVLHLSQVDKKMIYYKCLGYLIAEITPELIEVVECVETRDEKQSFLCQYTIDLKNKTELTKAVHINNFTNAISVKRIGIEKCNLSVQLKTSSGYTKAIYDNIYHIANKEEYLYTIGDETSISFEKNGYWRGHWRAFYLGQESNGTNIVDYTRIGKTRSGEYSVSGYTWVTEHVRGDPEHSKIRNVISKKESNYYETPIQL